MILIIGAGGHGKVIADIALRQGVEDLGFLDDKPANVGGKVFSIPILGLSSQWSDFKCEGIIVGVGDNLIRRQIVQRAEQYGMPPWVTLAHPNSVFAHSAKIGLGTVLMAGAIVNADTEIGGHCILNTGATVDHDCILGHYVHVAPGANIAGGVCVGDGALLGIGCVVLPGIKVGEGAIIGAGAVVVNDVPAYTTAMGVPAHWDNSHAKANDPIA